ncbi:MAG: hypothetical protein GF347_04325 [Candidatus Moranbacteria bacterium]|nr:hypothetical protein [Candidatus Moranbacteria bacterium]
MKIKLYQNGTTIDEKQKKHFDQKLTKLDKYLTNPNITIELEIEKDKKGLFRAEIQTKIPGQRYIGEEEGTTPEEAFDLAIESLKNQIRRDKEKRRTLQKRANLSIKKKMSIDDKARF